LSRRKSDKKKNVQWLVNQSGRQLSKQEIVEQQRALKEYLNNPSKRYNFESDQLIYNPSYSASTKPRPQELHMSSEITYQTTSTNKSKPKEEVEVNGPKVNLDPPKTAEGGFRRSRQQLPVILSAQGGTTENVSVFDHLELKNNEAHPLDVETSNQMSFNKIPDSKLGRRPTASSSINQTKPAQVFLRKLSKLYNEKSVNLYKHELKKIGPLYCQNHLPSEDAINRMVHQLANRPPTRGLYEPHGEWRKQRSQSSINNDSRNNLNK
jgi:hypothetical protein